MYKNLKKKIRLQWKWNSKLEDNDFTIHTTPLKIDQIHFQKIQRI